MLCGCISSITYYPKRVKSSVNILTVLALLSSVIIAFIDLESIVADVPTNEYHSIGRLQAGSYTTSGSFCSEL